MAGNGTTVTCPHCTTWQIEIMTPHSWSKLRIKCGGCKGFFLVYPDGKVEKE